MTAELQIFDGVRPELAPFLRDTILDRAARIPGEGSNNVGGWKSTIDFFDWPHLEIQKLHAELFARVGGYPVGWAMVNRTGSRHKRHTHGFHYTCGIYYVSPGDPATPTIFELPAAPGGKIEQHVEPRAGRMVVFPGSLFHSVPIYEGTEPRISIAFELRP